VGESAAAVPLVEGIRQRWPELGIVVSTITPTGARIVGERLAGAATHRYFPIDLPGPVRHALDATRPRFFIAIETELWPNFLRALARRRIPAMIANGRISDRSFRRYGWVRGLMRRVLADVSVFAMQTEEDARRIISLGAPPARVVVTGNLKSDLLPEPDVEDAAAWRERLCLTPAARLWIAGSTHRGEETIVLDAFLRARTRCPDLALLLAPRHPERVGEVEALIRERGLAAARRSRLPADAAPGAVVILDTVGELAALCGRGDRLRRRQPRADRRAQRPGAGHARQAGARGPPHEQLPRGRGAAAAKRGRARREGRARARARARATAGRP
jgi:3-deoxy-D-manno-octulosonic-acid transferase